MLGWEYGGACAWQASVMVKELQLQHGEVRLVHHVVEALWWVGGGRVLHVVLG